MRNEIIKWGDCEKGFLRKVDSDSERVLSIKKKALRRLERARKENEVDFAVEDYYETVKELLTAYLLKNGLRSKNHQCLISFFLRENPEREREALLIQQMSFFRNRLTYYGDDIPDEFFKDNKDNFEEVIKYVLRLLDG